MRDICVGLFPIISSGFPLTIFFACLFICFVLLRNGISLCNSSACTDILFVDQVSLELTDICLSLPPCLAVPPLPGSL